MNINLQTIVEKMQPGLVFLKRYAKFIFFIGMLMVFGFLVFRINQFSNLEPSDDAITEKLQTVQRLKLDQSVIDKIQQLQSQNIQVQSLFDQARNNPFSE